MWALDRDIAIIDPIVFRDVAWAGQTISRGDAKIEGSTLSVMGSVEVPFDDAGLESGHVVNAGGFIVEVESVLTGTSLTVTVLRPTLDSPTQQPRQLDGVPFTVISFRTQIEWAHRQVLTMLGLRADADAGTGLSESAVKNSGDLVRLEALGALHLIYSAAGALEDATSPNNQRAQVYRRRFADERMRAVARIDTDGDGVADAVRRFNVLQLSRA
jgi:hypothetical protein